MEERKQHMKIVDMSRKDNLFWSLNIAFSLLLCLAVYAVGHSDALAGALYGQKHAALLKQGFLGIVYNYGCEFTLAWTLVFTVCYVFRGSFVSLKKGLAVTAAVVVFFEVIRLVFMLTLTAALGGIFTGLAACALGGVLILKHENVLA